MDPRGPRTPCRAAPGEGPHRPHRHGASLGHRGHAVLEQVGEHLLHLAAVGDDLRNNPEIVIEAINILRQREQAAETADAKRDFATLACRDVMRLSGAERDIALAFTHGYMLGKKGTTQYDVDALAQITDQFIDYCLDHPAENALQSFEKFAK